MSSEGKFFMIQSKLNELVVDISGGDISAGTGVVTAEQSGADSQLWYEDNVAGVIRCKGDDKLVLEAQDGQFVVNDYKSDEYNQKWEASGDRVCHRENKDWVLCIVDGAEDPESPVGPSDDAGEDFQRWGFVHTEPVHFFIVSKDKPDQVISVDGVNSDPGTPAVLYDRKPDDHKRGNQNQRFYEDKYGIIHSDLTGFVFDTADKSGKCVFKEYDSDIPSRQYVRSGNKICLKTDGTKVLTAKAKMFGNASLRAEEYRGDEDQIWTFDYI